MEAKLPIINGNLKLDDNFKLEDLKGKYVIGGRKGGMPQMVFEYVLKKNGIDPATDLKIDQSIDFGSTAAAFSGGKGDYTIEFEPSATALETEGAGFVVASLGEASGYVPYTAFCAKGSYIEENPESGLAYSLLIGQLMHFKIDDQNPIVDLCSDLSLKVEEDNAWANSLSKILAERQRIAFSSSILSFTALDKDEKEYTENDIPPHKYVLVCFWASRCEPCKEEIPLLKELYKKYNSKGLEIVSISVDLNPMEWLEYTKANPLPWLSLWGEGYKLTAKYNFQKIPFNIIVDKDKKVIKQLYAEEYRVGEEYRKAIDKAIEELFDE